MKKLITFSYIELELKNECVFHTKKNCPILTLELLQVHIKFTEGDK